MCGCQCFSMSWKRLLLVDLNRPPLHRSQPVLLVSKSSPNQMSEIWQLLYFPFFPLILDTADKQCRPANMGNQIRKHCMCSSGGQKPFHVEIEKNNLSKQVINKSTFLQLWGFYVGKKLHGKSKNSWTDFNIWMSCSCTLIRTSLQTDTTSWWRINRILNSVICY